jgi:hypothetical protein
MLIFAGLLLGAWADGFMRVGAATLLVLAALTVASYEIDFAAAALGAWIGFIVGVGVKVGVAFLMIGIFLAAFFLL